MHARSELAPVVEVEEDVYTYEPADNGADPLWCRSCTCLVRIGERLFASGLETLSGAKPLNNVRWLLFEHTADDWHLQRVAEEDRTREPCPLVGFPGGPLFLSANPTLVEDPQHEGGGPARPEILSFDPTDIGAPYQVILPRWDGEPSFTEHSYRSFTCDPSRREIILFQNVGYTHSEWALRTGDGEWLTGKLVWPEREHTEIAPYDSTRARCNYATVVLTDRAVHFCGAAAYNRWDRVRTMERAGREWGPRWRRLMYTWTPDIGSAEFSEWIEISNTFEDGGWLFPGDLWVDEDGGAHIFWSEHAINERLRDSFFPDIKRRWALKYAVVRDGEITHRETLTEGGEGLSDLVTPSIGNPRLQVTPDRRLFICYYVRGRDESGEQVSENRVMEILPDAGTSEPVTLPLQHPLTDFFTATPRGGSPPSRTLEMLGYRAGARQTVSYARVRLY
ncbi:MAG: hypothetical protein U9R79_00610 [Armatimonadota bacterium]|nr:hypothetical protein [Armatimonadota bacterium]